MPESRKVSQNSAPAVSVNPAARSHSHSGRRVVVIGAGLGGLASALQLAVRGYQVDLLEKNLTCGGKMQQIRFGGFRFDTGPSLITMPDVICRLMERAEISTDNRPELIPMSPLCRYFYRDGVVFDVFQNPDRTLQSISTFAPGEKDAYLDFLAYSKELFRRTADAFLFNPLHDSSDLNASQLRDLFRIDALRTVSESVDRRFESSHLRMFFKRFSTYNGSSPFRAPATLNVIPHVELSLGGYYLRGGLYGLVELLEREAVRAGVRFHFGREVERIEIRTDRVSAVRTCRGDHLQADIVVSNCEARHTLTTLVNSNRLNGWRDWMIRCQVPSSSGFVLLLGCGRKWPTLSHHNIYFSGDYRREFEQIFEQRRPPQDPTIYVTDTSLTDAEDAPDGGSNLFILINVPWIREQREWNEQQTRRMENLLIRQLERSGLEGLGDSIQYRHSITPADFMQQYRSTGGSIYGSSSNHRLSAFLRPGNKVREIGGLYLVGGSTHPGGGIPLVLQSAMNAVDLIHRYER